uniref:Uncharacterized protein n=1 Tax=Aegilops tauschii subsp. strangulata TaxID=200361 RepID=A0A453A7T0_AEGTS
RRSYISLRRKCYRSSHLLLSYVHRSLRFHNSFLLSVAVSVSEVQALFELFKSISGSLIDDGLIHKQVQ